MMRSTMAAVLCLLLAGCAAPHEPERGGVWITVPREAVQCRDDGGQVVCRSSKALPVEDGAK